MDSKRSDIIRGINMSPLAKQIRDSVSTVLKDDQRHWNVTNEITQLQEPKKPRILVCGASGAGKSSLINSVCQEEVVGQYS
jgi:predicted GTPase